MRLLNKIELGLDEDFILTLNTGASAILKRFKNHKIYITFTTKQQTWFGLAGVEAPEYFLLSAGQKFLAVRGESHGFDDVVVVERDQLLALHRVPYLAVEY